MKFLGQIKEVPVIDYGAFYRDLRSSYKIILTSDYELEGRFDAYAVVYGRFDDSFCSGADPLLITENGKVEVIAEIEVCFGLLERLEKDGETDKIDLDILRLYLEEK
jgi:hypothetical protein